MQKEKSIMSCIKISLTDLEKDIVHSLDHDLTLSGVK